MLQIQRAVSAAEAVVLAHAPHDDVQERVADILLAKRQQTEGCLPVWVDCFLPVRE